MLRKARILCILILEKRLVREKCWKIMISVLIVLRVEKVSSMLTIYVENAQNHPLKFSVIKRYRLNLMIMMQKRPSLILSIKD